MKLGELQALALVTSSALPASDGQDTHSLRPSWRVKPTYMLRLRDRNTKLKAQFVPWEPPIPHKKVMDSVQRCVLSATQGS